MDQYFSVTQKIAVQRVACLLASAFEGGISQHWCRIVDYHVPLNPRAILDAEGTHHIYKHTDYPLQEGGAVICRIADDDAKETDEKYTPLVLDHMTVTRGLHLMAEHYPQHWGAFASDKHDAATGDVFLQLCLLGKVVYG